MYNKLKRIEKILSECTYYRIDVTVKNRNYIIEKEKQEEKEHNTFAVGFQIPSKNDYEIEDKKR